MEQLLQQFSKHVGNRNFNPQLRDEFVKEHATNIPNDSKVLDVSSGAKPYKNYFKHCNYTSHEFDGNSNITDVFRGENRRKTT